MRLSEAGAPLQADLRGNDVMFRGVSTDTRTVQAGQLFVALRGPRFDAHDFVDAAAGAGAAAALVERDVSAGIPYLKVADTRAALGQLAACWRAGFHLPLLAVTGSNGKTTVKEMLTAILAQRGKVLATRGNLNNDIGVPLTLFNLAAEHNYAVIEMGANHPGEIAQLCAMARPSIAAITLCAPAHLEGFGSIEGVARAKGEIVSALPADGTAVLNADDPYVDLWRELAGARAVLSFGMEQPADVSARLLANADPGRSVFELITPEGAVTVSLALPGRHNVMNALAAAACAHVAGADLEAVRIGLGSVHAMQGRLVIKKGYAGARVLDDSYNANPASLHAAITVLVRYPGRHWLILGDMGELGAGAEELHRGAGEDARAAGVQRLFGIGPLTRHAVTAFGAGAQHFDAIDTLAAAVRNQLAGDVNVLVKGSRAMRMERVVAAIAEGVSPCC